MKTKHLTSLVLSLAAAGPVAALSSSPAALPGDAGVPVEQAAPAQEAVPSIFPRPQECKLKPEYTSVTKVNTYLRSKKNAKASVWKKLPADKEGAYALVVTPGRLQVYANDETGLYYAKQTLSQMLRGVDGARNAQRDPFPDKDLAEVARLGELPVGTVYDWPDLAFRGVVEGYYGAPWSFEARKAQFEFYGRNKMNMYIFGPKDDPYHHGQGCYNPYPEKMADEIRRLVKLAKENHVRFVWAIHPANTVRWGDQGGRKQLDALCRKLEMMYDLGVRDFGVLVDDSSGEIGRPEHQAQLCNYLLENFVRKHKDVNQELIMCPTGYNRSWTNPQFLKTLGGALKKGIHVMWTGDTVVHDITLEGQRWVHKQLGRPTFIWWNWPVNDYKRSRLAMGRASGLGQQPEMKSEMTGFTANPMEQAEANKVGLFGVADYTWNTEGYDSVASWKEGIKRLYPETHEAMQAFCDHNSYLLPNVHGLYREESVDVAADFKALRASLSEGKPDAKSLSAVGREFDRIGKAGATLLKADELKVLRAEIEPWMEKFRATGEAGSGLARALGAEDEAERTEAFLGAMEPMVSMKTVTRRNWTPGGVNDVRDVEVGMLEVTPTLRAMADYLGPVVYASLSGRSAQSLRPTFICNGGNASKDVQKLTDGDARSFWSSDCYQKVGHWYGYDFGEPTLIRSLNLVMGGPRAKDVIAEGQLEFSMDGETWKPIGKPMSGSAVVRDFGDEPIRARAIRYRVTKANPNWLTLCEFTVNRSLPATASSNIAGHANLATFRDAKMVGINRVMEVFSCRPGDYLEISLPTPVRSTWLEVNLENESIANWATIELTLEDGSKVKPKFHMEGGKTKFCCNRGDLPKQRIKAMRLTNTSKKAQEIKLTTFKLDVPAADPDESRDALTDADFTTAYSAKNGVDVQLEVPEGAREAIVVGSADCSVSGAEKAGGSGAVMRFRLPEGARSVDLKAPRQPDAWVYEVIFK